MKSPSISTSLSTIWQFTSQTLLSIAQLVFRNLWVGVLLMTLTLGAGSAWATGVYQIPDLTTDDQTFVFDQDEILSRSTESRINRQLTQIADETDYQVRFVTIRRLDYGETIDSFADQLFDKWFASPESITDGSNQVFLVLDTQTNNSAIRTGEAVQSVLTNEIAQSIASETLQAPIRDGNKYNEAFKNASDRLAVVLSGQPDPGAPKVEEDIQVASTFKSAEETDDFNATIIVVIVLVVATVAPMATYFYFQR
ncbi:MAG: photosystem II repair protein Psb32 [Microcoleaceae cyanobacterium]